MFIQIIQGKCTRQDELRALAENWRDEIGPNADGWLGGTYGFTDDDRFVGVVRFESRDGCEELSRGEEAAIWWAAAETCFDGSCKIHESEDVSMMLDGGSDSAGFVQVMCGKVGDADKLRHMMTDTQMTSMLHEARPEIIGSTLAIEPDGSFVETVSFTDEATARKGEQMDMPAEVTEDLGSAMAEVEYLDLHHPWFATHR